MPQFVVVMDDDGLNMRNWGYYEPSFKAHLGLQLMSSVGERDTKPFLSGREHAHAGVLSANGGYHPRDCVVSETPLHMDYVRDSWVNNRDKFLNMLPGNSNYAMYPEPSASHSMHILQPPDLSKDGRVGIEDPNIVKEGSSSKKRTGINTPKAPKVKKAKKGRSLLNENGDSSIQRVKPTKKNVDVVINGIDMDISGIPVPVCSCTGSPQQCYRWGSGGWQSACCTTTISIYPLPMSTKRRGSRIAGRKMSMGAFKKVLEKLAAEGYDFCDPIDLRTHWAKHGTNKFVTIR